MIGQTVTKRLKLQQKVLLTVGVPLLCEMFFVAVLIMLLNQAEADIHREYHAKLVVVESTALGKLFYDAGTALAVQYAGLSHDDDRLNRCLSNIQAQLHVLQDLPTESEFERECLHKIRLLADEELQLLSDAQLRLKNKNSGLLLAQTSELRERAQTIMSMVAAELNRLSEFESSAERVNPDIAAHSRQRVQVWLAAGVLLNLVAAIFVSLFLSREFIERIGVISANSLRLMKSQALAPEIGGADEIAYLDKVFHQMADALLAAQAKERMLAELKQQFVAMVSHELRTPLSSVTGILTLLQVGALGTLPEQAQVRVGAAKRNCDRLMVLINDILDVERLESGKMDMQFEEIELGPIVTQSIDSIDRVAESQQVKIEFTGTDLTVFADEHRLIQVLVNLLSNAIKYSPAAGVVRIMVEPEADLAKVSVQDQGRGIPAHLLDSVFERFRQVTVSDATKKGGSGLGLAISKAIVEQHGGQIGVESQEGAGSTFWFTIPMRAHAGGVKSAAIEKPGVV